MQGTGRDVLSPRRAVFWFAFVAVLTVVLDQATKALVRSTMQPGDTIPLIDDVFHITFVRNTGAAFGLMPGQRVMFIGVAIAVLIGTGLYLWLARPTSRWAVLGLGLMAGGAVGNLIDRILVGRVTDFFDPRVFPVFNIADIGIVVGAGLLILVTLFTPVGKEAPSEPEPDGEEPLVTSAGG